MYQAREVVVAAHNFYEKIKGALSGLGSSGETLFGIQEGFMEDSSFSLGFRVWVDN